MSFFKAGWWRPASALIVLALAVAAFSAGGRGTALAVTTDGSVSVTPADLMIGAGGTGQLSVDMTPAAAGTSIWIVEIAYDPAVAQVATDNLGNPVCTPVNVSNPFVGGGNCATKAVSHGSTTPDTLVILGGVVQNDNGTAKGFTTPQTLATFTFNAVGASGAHTALTTTVTAFLGPNGQTPTPATSDGAIDITPGTSRIWGDGDCGGDIGPRDAQAVLKNVLVQTPLSQTQPCPAVGASVSVDGVSRIWSDWDCGGDIGPRDAQAILKNVLVQTPLSQTQPCPAVGSTVQVVG